MTQKFNIVYSFQKKHCAHMVTSDVSIGETASAASFFLADGLIITGSATGAQANPEDVSDVVKTTTPDLPILIGSGITPENACKFSNAHGFIVGSYLKEHGLWSAKMDEQRVIQMVKAVHKN